MSQKVNQTENLNQSNEDCLLHFEVKGEDVHIQFEGGARNLAELIANAAVHSEEINTVLKAAMMMLIHFEMSEEEDNEEPQVSTFGGAMGQA
jgi:hypothetical protein